MREIIFRSWNEIDQCFYYFTQVLYFDSLEFNNEVDAFFFKWANAEEFTGLTDKNGNKIFEGDKFAFVNGQVRENDEWTDNVEEYFVEYMIDTAGFLLTTGFGYDSRNCKKLDCDIIYHSEIIGNIHESLTPNK
ncbi:hypothetical protein HZR00_08495 [Elizabethkingia anophelis]|nr:hypothetical protein [Elizabethkingia anophelis]